MSSTAIPIPTSQVVESFGSNQAATPNGHETAHVLFLDVVGFTKLRSPKQRFVLGKLQDIVRATKDFREAKTDAKLIALPTGDGMALVFLTVDGSGRAVSCAEKITQAVLAHNKTTNEDDAQIHLRMGIHSGNVVQVLDVNERLNVAGEGINTAQRVMDCGDVGHILLSNVAFDLLPDEPDRTGQFKTLGIVKVKHDQEINLFSWCHEEIGNQQTPAKIDSEKKQDELRFEKIKAAIEKDEAIRTEKIKTDLEAAAKRERRWWLLAICVVIILMATTVVISRAFQSSSSPVSLYVRPFDAQTPDRYSSRAISKGLTQDFRRSFRFLLRQEGMNSSGGAPSSPNPSPSAQTNSRHAFAIAVGRQMGVRYVLTGTVESDIDDGDRTKLSAEDPTFRVQLNVELYDTESERVWLKSYTATSFRDLIDKENLVLNDVCDEIHVRPNRDPDDDNKRTAHWEYLVGRFWAFQRAKADVEDKKEFTRRANSHYDLARKMRINPYYALALSGLADIKLSEAGLTQDPTAAARQALAFALEATAAQNPTDAAQNPENVVAEPYAAVGTEKWWVERDYLSAIIAFQLAIKLDPNLADTHKRYSSCLAVLGKEYQALARTEMNTALRLEPESPVFQLASGQNHYFARNYEQAITQLRDLISTQAKRNETKDPAAYRFLAMALERSAKDELERSDKGKEALELLGIIEKEITADSDFLSAKAHILARLGQKKDALKIAEDLKRRKVENDGKGDKGYMSSYNIAVIYAPMPDKQADTLYWLKRAKDESDPRLNWLKVDPRFKEWQESEDPRFTALLQDAGLLPQSADRATTISTAGR